LENNPSVVYTKRPAYLGKAEMTKRIGAGEGEEKALSFPYGGCFFEYLEKVGQEV